MSNVVEITSRHPLVGTWRDPDGDSSAEYVVSSNGSAFTVTGVDTDDDEHFVISDVSWDGSVLRFTSSMPSTQFVIHHEFRALSRTEIKHTYIRHVIWQKS